jgi:2-octaprenyl-6-methoxyphenol hydroxylase
MSPSDDSFSCDIVIIGAGIPGLMMATAMAQAGWHCRLIDAYPMPTATQSETDQRTIAVMMTGIELLKSWGIWPMIAADSAPLRELWLEDDAMGWPVRQGFSATEIGQSSFGYNIPAAGLRMALIDHLRQYDHVDILAPCAIEKIENTYHRATIYTKDAQTLTADLVIVMDGVNSPVREMLGIQRHGFGVNQMAMVCHVDHDRPHNDISTEFHGSDGQVTLIPMPGQRSAINIVGTEKRIAQLNALSGDDFQQALGDLTRNELGKITAASAPRLYPVRPMRVRQWVAGRFVLAGEAAHVMPPIGAQGLNITFGDIACLTNLVGQKSDGIDTNILRQYQRSRQIDLGLRCAATGALARVVHGWMPGIDPVRRLGLELSGRIAPLRRALMRFGMASSGR